MANIRGVSIVLTLILGLSSGQEDPRVTMMDRQSLHEYSLAKCSDGSTAAYYTDKVNKLHPIYSSSVQKNESIVQIASMSLSKVLHNTKVNWLINDFQLPNIS